MTWTVVWSDWALRDLERLEARLSQRIVRAMVSYGESARGDVKKLQGEEDRWRLRVGDWRVIFRRDSARRELLVLRVFPRQSAYRE